MFIASGVLALALALAGLVPADSLGPRARERFPAVRAAADDDGRLADVVRPDDWQRADRQRVQAPDRWFDVDKAQHFAMSYGSAVVGYSVLRGVEVDHGDAEAAALAGSLVLGIGKELADRARGGTISYKDLVWDALGTLAAWGLISLNR